MLYSDAKQISVYFGGVNGDQSAIDRAKSETLPAMTTPSPRPACGPLRLGELVPNVTARSTTGPVSLADFRGRWLVLFSHPGDFTPVCTSEFVAIAKARPQFDALDCALMALSVDSLFSHLAWIRLIHDRFGIEINFPIVEDPT